MALDLKILGLLPDPGYQSGQVGTPAPVFSGSAEATKLFTQANGFTLTFSKTITTGANRILVVVLGFDYTDSFGVIGPDVFPGAHIETVTFNAVNLTRLGRSDLVTGGTVGPINGLEARVEIWYLLNPPVTTANVVVTTRTLVTGVTESPFCCAAWDLVDANQTIPFGQMFGEVRRSGAGQESALVDVSSNLGELVLGICLGRSDFDMDVGSCQVERFEVSQAANTSIIVAGSTEPGAPCVPTRWTNTGSGLWVIGGAGLVGTDTARIAPVTQFQETFESLSDGDLGGQGGWTKLVVVGPDTPRWTVNSLGVIDGTKSVHLIGGTTNRLTYSHSVPFMTASTDRRKWTIEFQMNQPYANGGFFMWWVDDNGSFTSGTRFSDVPFYVSILDDFGSVRIILNDNISLNVDIREIVKTGVPHTLSVEFFPPDQVTVILNSIGIGTFTTTPSQNDYNRFAWEIGGTVANEDKNFIMDSILDVKIG